MDRGAWWATVHGVAKSWTRLKQLSMHALFTQIKHKKKQIQKIKKTFLVLQYSPLKMTAVQYDS